MKIAKRRVAGWKTRHSNTTKVAFAIQSRMRRGFIIQQDEANFYDYVIRMCRKYSPEHEIAKWQTLKGLGVKIK